MKSERLRGALAGVWLKSRDRMFDRVAIVEAAALQLMEGPMHDEPRREAERAAHQLAGTCGTFGFIEATDIAREAEHVLAGDAPIPPNAVLRLAEIAVALREQLSAGLPGLIETPEPSSPEVVSGPAHEADSIGGTTAVVSDDAEVLLALDDDPLALDVINALVRRAGYRLVATTDPNSFLELLATQKPSLVILDVDMPTITGFEMCRRLRADPRWVALPVLFLTSQSDPESVTRMFEAGADDFTAKPVAGRDLVARIKNRLERSRLPRATALLPSHTTDVVLVEDDDVLVGLLEQSLSNAGYSVTAFGDGPTALDSLTSTEGNVPRTRPRVIVLDVGLPGMDGLTVLRALARQGVTKRSRVVMLTARTTEQEVVQALELGAFDHVAKPFSVPILMQRIRRAFDVAGAAR